MKKYIIIAAILFATTVKAQSIDTTVTSIAACKIVGFKAQFTDTSNAYYLGVRIFNDNLKDNCQLYWVLMDKWQNKLVEGNASIGGAAYTSWNGSNLYPFIYLGQKYSITFK